MNISRKTIEVAIGELKMNLREISRVELKFGVTDESRKDRSEIGNALHELIVELERMRMIRQNDR